MITIPDDFYFKNILPRKKITGEKHYENPPIQIYRKFHLQKLKIFR